MNFVKLNSNSYKITIIYGMLYTDFKNYNFDCLVNNSKQQFY